MTKNWYSPEEVKEYLDLNKWERELAVLLYCFKDTQKLQLTRLERIKVVANRLSCLKSTRNKDWYKALDEDIKKEIWKYRQH